MVDEMSDDALEEWVDAAAEAGDIRTMLLARIALGEDVDPARYALDERARADVNRLLRMPRAERVRAARREAATW